jgi:hypothetical protein
MKYPPMAMPSAILINCMISSSFVIIPNNTTLKWIVTACSLSVAGQSLRIY